MDDKIATKTVDKQKKVVLEGLSGEPLLKGKAQYSWPPNKISSFCKKKEKCALSVLKAADLNL